MQEMVIFTRVHQLLEWLIPQSRKFPQQFRFSVTQRLVDSSLDLLEELTRAESQRGRERLAALSRADASLTILKQYLKLAHRWGWLADSGYEHVSLMALEIGKLLGGWIRQTRQQVDPPGR
jgi:hypothetical protein